MRYLNVQRYQDGLTKLLNRWGFDVIMATAGEDTSLKKAALIAIDLNNFKSFNDIYGHDNGDVLLRTFAEELVKLVGKGGTVARNGGDEFQILLENPANHHIEYIRYRVITKDATEKSIIDVSKLIRHEYYGDIYVAFLLNTACTAFFEEKPKYIALKLCYVLFHQSKNCCSKGFDTTHQTFLFGTEIALMKRGGSGDNIEHV